MTFMKVTAMTSGEIDYTPTIIDNLNATVPGQRFIPLVPFEDSTYIFYYLFIMIMPIALVNLLVSIKTTLSRRNILTFCFLNFHVISPNPTKYTI